MLGLGLLLWLCMLPVVAAVVLWHYRHQLREWRTKQAQKAAEASYRRKLAAHRSKVADWERARGPLNASLATAQTFRPSTDGAGLTRLKRDETCYGTFLATGAYISNWAALSAYQTSNIAGQWKRAFTAATVAAFNGAGGIAGSFIVRQQEAPGYATAVWVSIGSHLLIVGVVGVFSAWFWFANRGQREGRRVLEGVEGFRYTY